MGRSLDLRPFPRGISTPFYTLFFWLLFRLVFYTFLSTPRFKLVGRLELRSRKEVRGGSVAGNSSDDVLSGLLENRGERAPAVCGPFSRGDFPR